MATRRRMRFEGFGPLAATKLTLDVAVLAHRSLSARLCFHTCFERCSTPMIGLALVFASR
jgi:hypothetical protein